MSFALGALGTNGAGTAALQNAVRALYRVQKAVADVGQAAATDPAAALRAEVAAKTALAEAEGFIKAASAARVFIPSEIASAYKSARAAVADLGPITAEAARTAEEMASPYGPFEPVSPPGPPPGTPYMTRLRWGTPGFPELPLLPSGEVDLGYDGLTGLGWSRRRRRRRRR